jgi:hypothetical protein
MSILKGWHWRWQVRYAAWLWWYTRWPVRRCLECTSDVPSDMMDVTPREMVQTDLAYLADSVEN